MMVKVLIGNLFDSTCSAYVNTVNCVGVMGKGVAKEFKLRYPEMYQDYVLRCKNGQLKPGLPYEYYDFLSGKIIINFPTKDHWRSPSRLSYIIDGLNWIKQNYSSLGLNSIAFPPLGCGNGGLDWRDVGPLMYNMLHDIPIDIEIYAPYDTKKEYLSSEYLSKNKTDPDRDIKGKTLQPYNRNWDILLYVIQELNKDRYSLHVGRTIYQKICYILTISGIPTGFVFQKSSYGPFSVEAKKALAVLYNNNYISEKENGKMLEIHVNDSFKFDETMYDEDTREKINRAFDLLYRIKNTESAEITASVIFAYNDLKANKKEVKDEDILTYLFDWKKRWNNKEYETILKEYIVELAGMNWIEPGISYKTFDQVESSYY